METIFEREVKFFFIKLSITKEKIEFAMKGFDKYNNIW